MKHPCAFPGCDMPPLAGYRKCPAHLNTMDSLEFNAIDGPQVGTFYRQYYGEDAETVDTDAELYTQVEAGWEVASYWVDGDGCRHYHLVRID
jgi:hypothetical protein